MAGLSDLKQFLSLSTHPQKKDVSRWTHPDASLVEKSPCQAYGAAEKRLWPGRRRGRRSVRLAIGLPCILTLDRARHPFPGSGGAAVYPPTRLHGPAHLLSCHHHPTPHSPG